MTNLKQRIRDGETVLGCWLYLGSPAVAEIVGRAGFDWVLIDLEHGSTDERDVLPQLQALAGGTAAPIVRVESGTRPRIQRVLDVGARGVMVPQIRTVDEARAAVDTLHYPPTGRRGAARLVRATGYGDDFAGYRDATVDTLVGMVQIETTEALEAVDEIAALAHVDVLFVGPADLSFALGIFGQFEHPRYHEALERVAGAARRAGKAAGALLITPAQYALYADLGFRVLACGADTHFLREGARDMVERLKAAGA